MWKWRQISLNCKSLNLLMISAVLMLALVPVHLHLHHLDEAAVVTHEMDLHVVISASDPSHHDEAHILDVVPDVLAKKSADKQAILLLVVLLLAVLPVVLERLGFWLREDSLLHTRACYHLIPPLRAPPRH